MVNKSFDFYKDNLPYGFPVTKQVLWTTVSKPELEVSPETSYILFVKEITYFMTEDFDISAGTLRFTHSDEAAPNSPIDITEADQLVALGEASVLVVFPTGTNKISGGFKYNIPVKCDASATESYKITQESAVTVSAGHLHITVHGWQMLKTDYEEVT